MGTKIAVRVIISGKVQGVFFRAETQKAAQDYGVTGWVRNLSDGTVEAWAEGAHAQVDALVAWCHQGSPMSRVDHVAVTSETVSGRYTTFDVTY